MSQHHPEPDVNAGTTSSTTPSASDSPAGYWTAGKILAGLWMAVVAFAIVAVVQWDDVTRLMGAAAHGEDGTGAGRAVFAAQSVGEAFDMENLQVPRERVRSGGPPKDGIPSLTDPKTAPVGDADFMRPDDRVVGVTINGESRAYPIKVLNWHECYNDTLGGVPIAVVFCPLCDSVTVVDRRLNGKTHEFGISGLLYNSNVLLYDRQDDALWSQAGLIAISGPNAGKSLKHLTAWRISRFEDWRDSHPDSTVATLDTGYYSADRYNATAYASYFTTDELMFPVEPTSERFKNKFPVLGVRVGEVTKAYPLTAIAAAPAGRVEDVVNGERVVLESDGTPAGVRVVEAPEGSQTIHTFWFAWYAFHPDTAVYAPSGE